MSTFPTWASGAALAVVISLMALRARALTGTGALAAALAGTAAMGAGWSWGIVLVAYFVAASALSRFRARDKDARTDGRVEKGGARDALQVAANGGVFAVAALFHWMSPHDSWKMFGAAALAASSADTWATEIGTLARAAPRSILNGRIVPVGTSGGITAQGLLGAAGGTALVAGIVWLADWSGAAVTSAIIGGVTGSMMDSLLGAAAQARRWCPKCQADTERRVHRCGAATDVRGGISWLDNDGVNLLSTLSGGLLGMLAAHTILT